MKRVFAFVALAICSAVLGFGQGTTLPEHPLIVKRLALQNQTQVLGTLDAPLPLFTPTHNGLYRVTGYLQAAGNPAMICSASCVQVVVVYAPNAFRFVANFGGSGTTAVPGISGQMIGFCTSIEVGGPFMNYDLVIVVEEL